MTPNLIQDITYWSTSPDGFGGYTFSAPQALKGRWEDKNEMFRTPNGLEKVSNAIVYLDTDVEVDGFLLLGTSSASDPTSVVGAVQIAGFRKIPNLGAVRFERKAFL